VEVVATGEPGATEAVEALVRELLGRLPVAIEWAYAPHIDLHEVLAHRTTDPGVVARVWVDFSDLEAASVIVVAAATDRFLVRWVPTERGNIEVEQEAVAQIIGFTVEAILEGAEIGVTRDVAARQILAQPMAHPEQPPPLQHRVGASEELGAFVGLRAIGPGPAVGIDPGLLFALSGPREALVRPLLVAELQYEAPVDLEANDVAVRLEGVGGTLQGGIEARLASRLSLRATAGLGADAIHAQPQATTGSAFAARGPFWLGAAVATARVGIEVRVAASVSLFASAGFDLDMSGVSFPVSANGSTEPNAVPWRAWPVASLGASVSLSRTSAPQR
jgi:hypothetical protein